MKIKGLKKELGITNSDIAEFLKIVQGTAHVID